tara:strand:- start:2 stop:922 length:921 start_codon:yes stop_codon:yes gene_type:complete
MTKTFYDTKYGGRIYEDSEGNKSVDYSYVLTTTPERIEERDSLSKTIESLKNQSVKPKKIHIAIPKHYLRWGIDFDVPQWLNDIPEVEINRCDDYGPATKWMCASYVDTEFVIVCDDDRELKPKTAEILIASLDDNQSTSFYGMWWWNELDEDGRPNEEKWVDETFLICQAADSWITPTKILEHFPSFWYRAFNYYEQSFYVDDVVISAYMKYSGVNMNCMNYDEDDSGAATNLPTSQSEYSLYNQEEESTVWLRVEQQTKVRDKMLEMIKTETNLKSFPTNMVIKLTEDVIRRDGKQHNPIIFNE